jgi:predicted DNA-binding transcriptional regulator AlpA
VTPSPYISRTSLAAALEISVSTLDGLVRRGVLPKGIKMSDGCIRWRWATVDERLAALGEGRPDSPASKEQAGVQRAIEAAQGSRRGRSA